MTDSPNPLDTSDVDALNRDMGTDQAQETQMWHMWKEFLLKTQAEIGRLFSIRRKSYAEVLIHWLPVITACYNLTKGKLQWNKHNQNYVYCTIVIVTWAVIHNDIILFMCITSTFWHKEVRVHINVFFLSLYTDLKARNKKITILFWMLNWDETFPTPAAPEK